MENKTVKGYKVFNHDWTCRDKQYACPGKFEEDVKLRVCDRGMHFCKKAADCFIYYAFDPQNKVAEIIAYGKVLEDGNKCCTDKLEIVRELSWHEVLELVNTGTGNTGRGNSGNYNCGNRNSGNWNSGNRNSENWNSGNWNSGNRNSGNWNSGNRNSGNRNSGNRNSGNWNSGNWNSGNWNSGNCNSGNWNSGNCNSGNCNSGHYNSRSYNSGNYNSGSFNSGDYNSGNCNSGDWNKANYSNGCFNTVSSKIYLFNKPSDLTYIDWLNNEARRILEKMPFDKLVWVASANMTDEEKTANPEYETTGGYLKKIDSSDRLAWWHELSDEAKNVIKAIPNFDKEIFKEITGIDIEVEV